MYTAYIGNQFLELYNQHFQTQFNAEQFFEEIFFPLFFEDESHLMHVGNSPFFQKPKDTDVQKYGGKAVAQLNNLRQNIDTEPPNMSIYVGYAAKDIYGTTSGQLSSMTFPINKQEMYASWLGQALSIGVKGGYVMLINHPTILMALFEGWQYYRQYLQQTPNVKDKQIETWNGQWLCHRLSKRFNAEDVWQNFNPEPEISVGKLAIPTCKWLSVIFTLALNFPNQTLTAYCYNLSQTNTTLGFIHLFLPQINEMYELRDRVLLKEADTPLNDEQITRFETHYTFANACKMGSIGLKALEPRNLRDYMPKGTAEYAQGKDYKFTKPESFTDFQILKLWIIAMLNKTELLQAAAALAQALTQYAQADKDTNRGKTAKSQDVKAITETRNVREFIDRLTDLLPYMPAHAQTFKELVENVLKMPVDNFPLFITLVKFEYQYLQYANSSSQNKLF